METGFHLPARLPAFGQKICILDGDGKLSGQDQERRKVVFIQRARGLGLHVQHPDGLAGEEKRDRHLRAGLRQKGIGKEISALGRIRHHHRLLPGHGAPVEGEGVRGQAVAALQELFAHSSRPGPQHERIAGRIEEVNLRIVQVEPGADQLHSLRQHLVQIGRFSRDGPAHLRCQFQVDGAVVHALFEARLEGAQFPVDGGDLRHAQALDRIAVRHRNDQHDAQSHENTAVG